LADSKNETISSLNHLPSAFAGGVVAPGRKLCYFSGDAEIGFYKDGTITIEQK